MHFLNPGQILAGGGFKSGYVHGATGEIGYQAVQDRVSCHDLHATILHLFGLDHTRLSYRRPRLTFYFPVDGLSLLRTSGMDRSDMRGATPVRFLKGDQ